MQIPYPPMFFQTHLSNESLGSGPLLDPRFPSQMTPSPLPGPTWPLPRSPLFLLEVCAQNLGWRNHLQKADWDEWVELGWAGVAVGEGETKVACTPGRWQSQEPRWEEEGWFVAPICMFAPLLPFSP